MCCSALLLVPELGLDLDYIDEARLVIHLRGTVVAKNQSRTIFSFSISLSAVVFPFGLRREGVSAVLFTILRRSVSLISCCWLLITKCNQRLQQRSRGPLVTLVIR